MLGIDAGGSSTRWILHGDTGPWGHGALGPMSGLAFMASPGATPDGVRALVHDLSRAVNDVLAVRAGTGRPERVALGAVVAGVTGLTRDDASAAAVRDLLAEGLGVDPTRVYVMDDVILAYHSAFAPGEGIVVYAGTGSVAAHVDAKGTMVRVGGHGYLIDDAGGGYWIGRHALRAVLRQADRLGEPAVGMLAESIYQALGSRDWPDIRQRIYGGGRRELAQLVPVVRHAATHGDREALGIVEEAGRELARLAATLMERLGRGPLPVALTGGAAAGLGQHLRRAMARHLADDTELRAAERTPVEAAVHLAEERRWRH
ncbi:MAG: BadF/BadG/BcrA/BcrD ATPase family protein [Trueperaceae bacterium]|nr:BadF/BadG/BcrA/BcrD ATPase family protein [Trueperaceae bacterium]